MPPTDLDTLAKIASLIQTTTFIISVFFVWFQIRESNRLTRITNNRTSFQLASPLLMQYVQDRNMAELYVNGAKNYETLDEVDQFRYVQLLFWWLILHDDIYYQHQNGLLDADIYQGWDHELEEFIRGQHLAIHWKREIKPFFRPDFQEILEQKLSII